MLVAGGTGFIGRHLAAELTDRGHSVTALSRDPDPGVVPAEVKTRAGDLTSVDELPEAVAGHDAVVHLVSLSPLYQPRGGETRHEDIIVGGTRNLVRAMERAGVDRLVYQSGLGADPDGTTHYIRAKGRAEGIVRSSDLDWTITRPSVVFGDGAEFLTFPKLVTTPYLTFLPGGGHTRFQPIWIGDLVPIVAEIVGSEQHVGEHYEFGGPEILTLADVTRAIYHAEGRPCRILPIPMPVARVAMTVAGPLPLIPFGADQYRSLKFDNVPNRNDVERFDRDPAELTTLDSYLVGDLTAREALG